jgi:ankyrin repeat protein
MILRHQDDAIHWTVERGDVDAVKAVLEKDPGALERVDSSLLTPLHWAARRGHEEVSAKG